MNTLLISLFALVSLPIVKDEHPVVKLEQLNDRTFNIYAKFVTQAPTDLIFGTLTDYEHHPQFIHTIKKVVEVQSIQKSPNVITKIINEEITAHVLIFSETVHVTLKINEILDQHLIQFEDISHKDFVVYKGYWQVQPNNDGTNVVTHEIMLEPDFKVPTWIIRRLFRKDAKKLLNEVQEEIIRRSLLIQK